MSSEISTEEDHVSGNAGLLEVLDFATSGLVQDRDDDTPLRYKSRCISQRHIPQSQTGEDIDTFFIDYFTQHFGPDSQSPLKGLQAQKNIFKCVQVAAKVPDFATGLSFERRAFEELAAGKSIYIGYFGYIGYIVVPLFSCPFTKRTLISFLYTTLLNSSVRITP